MTVRGASGARKVVPVALLAMVLLLSACTTPPSVSKGGAQPTPATSATRDLIRLPPPKGKIAVAVYGFRDQTGQYKPAPDSSFSTSVTQGAASMLIKALLDSGWFTPVERENLQNLLTERKIVRAVEFPQEKNNGQLQIPQLVPASIIVEGGITAYESNVRTGGIGANFLGIGLSSQYRVDQVTINLRSVDILSGRVLTSVSTTKAIYSYEVRPSVFRFVNFKDLAQFETGMTRNEPAQLCVREAIETAVLHLIVQGLKEGNWELKDDKDRANPIIRAYGQEDRASMDAASVPTS
jgi:curli production assembly/transport component CsgG